jgi:hypothetical protein
LLAFAVEVLSFLAKYIFLWRLKNTDLCGGAYVVGRDLRCYFPS